MTLDVALSQLLDPDRDLRRETAEAVTAALEPGLRTRAYVFNTLLQDKAIGDRLRSYPHWLASRNLSNEASDESVQALVDAVQGRYELARRWYRVEGAAARDRPARRLRPDGERLGRRRRDPWDEGRVLVRDSFASFSDRAAEVVRPLRRRALGRRAAARRQARRRLLGARPSRRSTPT